MTAEDIDFRWENDSTMIVSGPSKCGKTTFVTKLIRAKDQLFQHPIGKVWWFHGARFGAERAHDSLCNPPFCTRCGGENKVAWKEGVPTEDDLEAVEKYDLVVLDDLQSEMTKDNNITSLFLKQSHHKHFFVIVMQQNIYGDKEQRLRNANVHYWVAFNNPRNQRQISEFLSRMYPSGQNAIQSIFKHILENDGNYGYLFVDFTPETRHDLRLRSHLFTPPMRLYKVNDRGGYSVWFAVSKLDKNGQMTYDTMSVVSSSRYNDEMHGGATRREIKSLLQPHQAYAENAAKEMVDFKLTPSTVSDYYKKLLQFDKIRREFFIPKAPPPPPPPPPPQPQPSISSMSEPLARTPTPAADVKTPSHEPRHSSSFRYAMKKRSKAAEGRNLARLQKPRLKLRETNKSLFQQYAQFPY